ncbi:MAG: ATP-binding cassette domain-containing protein [Methanomassiliicoccus sp.]|nr:ATP-binding cassette domain-containing protein [Methanomassiliicoccus sp.]
MGPKLSLTINGGVGKNGIEERIRRIDIDGGDIVGIVGPTGSGKSTLISDIEQLAQADTPSRRTILINGAVPDSIIRTDPRKKLVAQLSQNMHFLSDMNVGEFLKMHAKSRGRRTEVVEDAIDLANTMCGEPLAADHHLTALSGGQSRALMTADIALISDSPIVLIDEIENAGIRKQEALRLLSGEGKIVIVVTHDPVLALSTSRRIVMRSGGMSSIIERSEGERSVCSRLAEMDDMLISLREVIRNGEMVEGHL